MPNHVENHLTFDCSEERLKEILKAIGRDEDSALDGQYGIGTFDFNKVIPMPDDIYRGDFGPKEQKIYGKKNWYDWSCWNWGTKWNSYGNSFDGHTLTFQTAWSAPHPVIEKLSEMYPDVTISHRWADEDLGCNCGERDYRNGEITHEYIPDLQTDAMNLSLSVWGYEPEDMGLALNATGTAYINTDISGTRADKRPEFNRMIKDCLSGKIDYIITKSVSRFARNTVECLEYVRMLKARNIGILFEEQNIDTLKCDSELYLVIYAGFAQSESESMSKNITWAFRKNFEEGKVVINYKRMIGYRKGEDGKPEIVPEEAEIVRNIFDWFLSGKTPREIVEMLLADGIQTKCGKIKWQVSSILRILKNEKFCGDAILQKTVTLDCISKTHKKNTGEAPMYYVHNNHDPIVSRETFNKAQEELLRRNALKPATTSTVSAQGRYSRYALTEILHCDECGSRYKRCTWTASGEKQIVWRCINRLQHGKKYCSKSPTVKEGVLHSAIVRAINRFNQENETTYRLLMKASLSDALGIGGSNEEMELLTRRIDTLNAKMMKLINDAVSEGRSIDDNEGEFKEISDEIAQLNSRVSAIKELIANDESAKDRLESINAKVEELKDGITEYDDTIVRQMIECIKVYGDKRIEVIFGGGTSIIEEL